MVENEQTIVPASEGWRGQPAFFLIPGLHARGAFLGETVATAALPAAHAVEERVGIQKQRAQVFKPCDHVEPGDRIFPHGRFVPQQLVGVVRAVLSPVIKQIDVV